MVEIVLTLRAFSLAGGRAAGALVKIVLQGLPHLHRIDAIDSETLARLEHVLLETLQSTYCISLWWLTIVSIFRKSKTSTK